MTCIPHQNHFCGEKKGQVIVVGDSFLRGTECPVYGHWKRGQATRENEGDAVHHCREKNSCGQSLISVQAGQHCEGQQKGLLKTSSQQKGIRENIGPHLTRSDTSQIERWTKQRCLMPSPLSLTSVMGPGTPRVLCWRTVIRGRINFQPKLNLFEACCSSWMHVNLWGMMGFIPRY